MQLSSGRQVVYFVLTVIHVLIWFDLGIKTLAAVFLIEFVLLMIIVKLRAPQVSENEE